jgi:Zn-finger protein
MSKATAPIRNKCFECPGHFIGKQQDCLIKFCPLGDPGKKVVQVVEEKDPWD